MKPRKVLIITNIPTPYRLPLFKTLYDRFRDQGTDLSVLFAAENYKRRQWRVPLGNLPFRYQILQARIITLGHHERFMFTYGGLLRFIFRERPDVIVSNGFSLATCKVILVHWLLRIPFIIWTEGRALQDRRLNGLRKLQRRLCARFAAGFIVAGSLGKVYLRSLGVPEHNIHTAISTVDTEFFGRISKCRASSSVPSTLQLLTISYLVARKQIHLLFPLMQRLLQIRPEVELHIVGDGPERPFLEQRVRDLGLQKNILFHGYLQREQLAPHLKRANCFLFPTAYDPWGLTLIEAMAAGLTCLVSLHAGSAHDLIVQGENGFCVDFTQTEGTVQLLSELVSKPERLRIIGQRAGETIRQKASLKHAANAMAEAINAFIRP